MKNVLINGENLGGFSQALNEVQTRLHLSTLSDLAAVLQTDVQTINRFKTADDWPRAWTDTLAPMLSACAPNQTSSGDSGIQGTGALATSMENDAATPDKPLDVAEQTCGPSDRLTQAGASDGDHPAVTPQQGQLAPTPILDPESIRDSRFTWTECSLSLPEDLTPEEWEELAVSVRRADKAVQWWIGDLYNAQRWGDKGKEMERLGFNPKTAARYGEVAKKFPPGTRKNNLPFTHHMAVYKHEDAQELLKEAEKDALSVKDLKQRLKQRRSCVDQRAANPSRKHFSPQAHAEAEPRSEVPDPGDAPASGDDEGIDATASAERPKAPSAGCLTGSAPQTSTQPSETESSRQSRSKKESKDDRASIPAERRQAVLYASSLLKQLAEIHDAQAVLDALAEAGMGDLLSASAAQTINRPSPEEHNRHTTGQQEAA